jgi:hypothetical protein
MGTSRPIVICDDADVIVRRSARANKGQHSLLEREGRKRKIDVVSDEEGETRCLCGDDTDDGGFMIQCEMCGKWQHGQCMGFEDPEEVKETYACDVCRPDLYTDVPDKESKELEKKKKPAVVKKTKKIVTPVRRILISLICKKPAKRKRWTLQKLPRSRARFWISGSLWHRAHRMSTLVYPANGS